MADFSGHILSFTSLVVLAQVRGDVIFSYQRVGDSVTLKCANVLQGYPDCSSTTWIHSRDRSETIELIVKGKKESQTGPKASRLSLQPDCSLNISVIDVEDAGIYVCHQSYSNGEVFNKGENMHFSVLSGTVQNDTFMCSVASYDSLYTGLSLSWSSQGRSNTSQLESAGPCVTTLRRSDTLDSEALQCLLKKGSAVKASFTFPPRTKVTGPGGSEPHILHPVYLGVALGMGVLLLIVLVVLLVVRKKSTGVKQSPTKCVVDTNAMESSGMEEPVMCRSIGPGEPEEALAYASINHLTPSSKARRRSGDDGASDGEVTSSAISKPFL